jgi:hypothetical protein
MGVGFVFAGRAGRGGGSAAAMVSGVLSLFGKVGIWPQPDGGHIVLALLFFIVITPLGLALRMLGKDPLRLRRPVGARRAIGRKSGAILIGPAVLAAKFTAQTMRLRGIGTSATFWQRPNKSLYIII